MVAQFEKSNKKQYLRFEFIKNAVSAFNAEVFCHFLKLGVLFVFVLIDISMIIISFDRLEQQHYMFEFTQIRFDYSKRLMLDLDIQNGIDRRC
jgi:hypothetical protein